jgi:predicted dehydrogenase
MGWADIRQVASHPDVEVVACCDVDARQLKRATDHFKSEGFADYREMLAKMGDKIDAITVSTPDHTHAPAAMSGLLGGKHVYCQKPLTWSIHESRQLSIVSQENPHLATQMGIQRSASQGKRQAITELQGGIIGGIKEIYAWSDRPAGWWPQGQERPTGEDPVPEHLNWDLWLGTAEVRPYKEGVYAPFKWRGIFDFGGGAIGDMACHIADTPFHALGLTYPLTFRVDCDDVTNDQFPSKQTVRMTFAGNHMTSRDSLPFTWTDGGIIPPADVLGLPEGEKVPQNCCCLIGDEGTLLVHMDGGTRLFRNRTEVTYEKKELEPRNHYHHWVDGCLGKVQTEANFEFASRLTESMLLGSIGCHYPGSTLLWDATNLRAKNRYTAKTYVKREYRSGFEVENL